MENTTTTTIPNEFELFTDLTREMLNMIQHLTLECKELKKEVAILKKKQDVVEEFLFLTNEEKIYDIQDEKIITLVFVYKKPILYFSLLIKFIELYNNIVSNGLFVNPIHSVETELNSIDNDDVYENVKYFLPTAVYNQIRNKKDPNQYVDKISINLKESMVKMIKKINIIIRNDEFSFMNIYDNDGIDITSSFTIQQNTSTTKKISICF